MQKFDFKSISTDELWALHEEIVPLLSAKMQAEKLKLEKRLQQIGRKALDGARERRPYPEVFPRFRNPEPPHQTWSGRGKQPKWMAKALAQGTTADDLRIRV
jgi:DNA-binding protein H-NS